jgi:hypothetical protein
MAGSPAWRMATPPCEGVQRQLTSSGVRGRGGFGVGQRLLKYAVSSAGIDIHVPPFVAA